MALLKTLQEQVHIGFSGRVNLLDGNEKRYAGHILMDGGVIVGCRFEKATGQPALLLATSFDSRHDSLSKVVEPEIISSDMKTMALSVEKFSNDAKDYLRKVLRLRKVGLPRKSLFSINKSKLLKEETELLSDEFNLASILWDFKSFSDIIEKTAMETERVGIALLGLKEKKILLVKKGIEE